MYENYAFSVLKLDKQISLFLRFWVVQSEMVAVALEILLLRHFFTARNLFCE